MESFIHHIEWCVKDLEKTVNLLIDKYGFYLISERHSYKQPSEGKNFMDNNVYQKVVKSGSTVFILTQNNSTNISDVSLKWSAGYPILTCCCRKEDHVRNTVFNVCLEVKDVDAATERAVKYSFNYGSVRVILIPPTTIEYGSKCKLRYSVVRSICGNIIHTLINTKEYRYQDAPFLPGFIDVHINGYSNAHPHNDINNTLTSFIDHVTYVCKIGESKSILQWYQNCFGMERFLIGREEMLDDDGIEIGEEVGMRLTVGEWISSWMCREEGVKFNSSQCSADSLNFKLVLAEPLEGNQGSHVQQFMDEHGGPGIQHIGLTVRKDISKAVLIMTQSGAEFRKPPPTYYQLKNKKHEIEEANESVSQFERLGLLVDSEVDFCNGSGNITSKQYTNILIQIFTKPLFEQNTFFLEVLERRGARGFGAGNITALAKSIILQQKHENNSTSRLTK